MPAPTASLTPIQRRILELLAGLAPPFVLVGGGAIAGFYFGHRVTRDLDLFWRERSLLGELPREVQRRLSDAGLSVISLQTAPQFQRFSVESADEQCIVDLVAEPFASIESPEQALVEGKAICVDSKHEILASKLATLLERSEVRDLADVKALLDAGGDLQAGLRDAPKKDA